MFVTDNACTQAVKRHLTLSESVKSVDSLVWRHSRSEKLAYFKGLREGSTQLLQTQNELPPSGQAWRTEPLPEMPGHQFRPYGTRRLTDLCTCPMARATSLTPEPEPWDCPVASLVGVCGSILCPHHMRSQAGGRAAVPVSPSPSPLAFS